MRDKKKGNQKKKGEDQKKREDQKKKKETKIKGDQNEKGPKQKETKKETKKKIKQGTKKGTKEGDTSALLMHLCCLGNAPRHFVLSGVSSDAGRREVTSETRRCKEPMSIGTLSVTSLSRSRHNGQSLLLQWKSTLAK